MGMVAIATTGVRGRHDGAGHAHARAMITRAMIIRAMITRAMYAVYAVRFAAVSCAVLALAPAGPALSQSGETMRVENEYRECLYARTRPGRFRHDDRESDFALLGECRREWVAYMDLCTNQGVDTRTCVMKSRLVIHAILNLTGK